MINILQLIIHIQGLDILFPTNAQVYLLTLEDVLSFKILQTKQWIKAFKLNTLSENKQIASNLANAGYGSYSFLENLGVFLIALMGMVFVLLLLVLFKFLGKKVAVFDRVYKKIYKKLFFNGLTRYIM